MSKMKVHVLNVTDLKSAIQRATSQRQAEWSSSLRGVSCTVGTTQIPLTRFQHIPPVESAAVSAG